MQNKNAVKQADITLVNGKWLISGDLSFFNVMSVYQKSLPSLLACKEFDFDFSGLNSSDSGGLALIIEWIKLAKQQNKPIRFSHISDDLLSIAKAAALDQLIACHK